MAVTRIRHCRGLRQGDPLSPLLFILAIDPLQWLIDAATEQGILAPLPGRDARLRVSLYADDAVIFANPDKQEVDTLMFIISHFGKASGLCMNPTKSSAAPIRCENVDLDAVLQNFGGTKISFPVKYLGLPVTINKPRLVHMQFVLDRIRSRHAAWKRCLGSIAGQRVLVRSVLSAIPTFVMTVLKFPKKFLREIDKVRRRFLWAQDKDLTGGSCKVNWRKVCTPIEHGGLGIMDLEKFGRALRLRWLWLAWKSPERPWVGTELPCDASDRALFASATKIEVGDGRTASFWHYCWINTETLASLFPKTYKRYRKKSRTVQDALRDDNWVNDIRGGNYMDLVDEFIVLWRSRLAQLWPESNATEIFGASQERDALRPPWGSRMEF